MLTGGGLTAESESGGAQINVIARAGGNAFNGTFQAQLRRQEPAVEQSRRRAARARRDDHAVHQGQLRAGRRHRRPDLQGQAVVLRQRAALDESVVPARELLQRDAGHDVLHAGPRPARPTRTTSTTRPPARLTWQAAEAQVHAACSAPSTTATASSTFRAARWRRKRPATTSTGPTGGRRSRWTFPASSRLLFEAGVTVVEGLIVRRLTGGDYDDISILDMNRNYPLQLGRIVDHRLHAGMGRSGQRVRAVQHTVRHLLCHRLACVQGRHPVPSGPQRDRPLHQRRTSATRSAAPCPRR